MELNGQIIKMIIRESINHFDNNHKISFIDIKKNINKNYNLNNDDLLEANIISSCVNHPLRVNYSENQTPRVSNTINDFLFLVDENKVIKYSPNYHGIWEIIEKVPGKYSINQIINSQLGNKIIGSNYFNKQNEIEYSSSKEENELKISIITQEINNSFTSINQSKKTLINFITLYCTVAFGYFYYGSYVEDKIHFTGVANPKYFIVGIIGILLCLIIYLIGWALLSHVTRTIFTTIKQYKHISYMRKLASSFFKDDSYAQHCINPISAVELPIRLARSLPSIFCIVNFLFLFTSYFYLQLFLSLKLSLSIQLLLLGLLAIYYTNIISIHISELGIAMKLTPQKNELELRQELKLLKEERKKSRKFSLPYKALVFFSWVYCISLLYKISRYIYCYDTNPQPDNDIFGPLFNYQIVFLIILPLLSLYCSTYKVQVSFKEIFKGIKVIKYDENLHES